MKYHIINLTQVLHYETNLFKQKAVGVMVRQIASLLEAWQDEEKRLSLMPADTTETIKDTQLRKAFSKWDSHLLVVDLLAQLGVALEINHTSFTIKIKL